MEEQLPAWYQALLKIGGEIKAQDWDTVKQTIASNNKEISIEAMTVFPVLSEIYTIIVSGVTPDKIKDIELLYSNSLNLAQIELRSTEAHRIENEENLLQDLTDLNIRIKTSWRIVWNYWRGEEATDYKEWIGLENIIKTTPLTRVGRLRLLIRYQNIGTQIHPTFTKMVIQLWPLAALALIKKLGPVIIEKAVKSAVESRQKKKQMQELQDRILAVPKKKAGDTSGFFKPKPKRKRI